MPKKAEYLENLATREFYAFYRKQRRSVCPKITEYEDFKKSMAGFVSEIKRQFDNTEHGIHFKGFGVLYKKPFGDWYRRLSLFTHRRLQRGLSFFYLEDEFLRNKYIIMNNVPKERNNKAKGKHEDKADAILLHRKLLNKK